MATSDDEVFKTAGAAITALSAPTALAPRVELKVMPSPAGIPPEARFGERLKDARQQLGLTVEALSRLTKSYDEPASKGVSPPTLSRYESGDTLPTLRELRLLAEALDVPAQWLLDGNSPDVKGQAEAQDFIAALKSFINFVQRDIELGGGLTVSEHLESMKSLRRASLLSEAKRPTSPD